MTKELTILGEKGGGSSYTPREEDDTLFSHQTAKVLDLLSEGPIDSVSEVYLESNPITNYEGASTVTRTGTSTQEAVLGFTDVSATFVQGTQLTEATPLAYSVSGAGIDSVLITLGVSAMYTQTSKGDLVGNEVVIAIDTRDPPAGSWFQRAQVTLRGKTMNEYRRQVRVHSGFATPPNDWAFRLRRITADSSSAKDVKDTYHYSYDEIQDLNESYPDVAYNASFLPAHQLQGRIPTRTFDIKGMKMQIPNNYNPVTRVYTGIWDGGFDALIQYTNNPAWIILDLLTHTRYGMGISIGDIDKFAFYDVAEYCDELVESVPRFTFNSPITSRQNSWKLIQGIASVCHAHVLQIGGVITIVQDSPADVTDIVTVNDVVDGLFTYKSGTNADRANTINVTYNNGQNNFLKDTITVTDATDITKHGINEKNVIAYGCTDEKQAVRVGRWHRYSELSDLEVVEFTIGMNRLDIRPYSVIEIQDEHYASIRASGKVTASTGSTITFDAATGNLPIDSWRIKYYGQDGETLNDVAVTDMGGALSVVNGTFTDAALVGSSFLMYGSVDPMPFRVVGITQNDDNTFGITAVQYDAGKYANVDANVTLADGKYSIIDQYTQAVVTGLTAIEEHGPFNVNLRIDWVEPAGAQSYIVSYRRDNGNFITHTDVLPTEFLIEGALLGEYDIRVAAVNVSGVTSAYAKLTYDLESGSASSLNPVLSLQVVDGASTTEFDTRDCQIEWTENPANSDLAFVLKDYQVEVWDSSFIAQHATYWTIQTKFLYAYDTIVADQGSPVRSFGFKVYARDVKGAVSSATNLVVTNPTPAAPSLEGGVITAGLETYWIDIVPSAERDTIGYVMHASTSTGFTPGPTNLIYDGPNSNQVFAIEKDVTLYVKVAAYDSYGKTGLNYSSEYSTTGVGVADEFVPTEYRYEGLDLRVTDSATDTVTWDAGTRYNLSTEASQAITSGSDTSWSSGILYFYNETDPTDGTIKVTASLTTALANKAVILASYRGGSDLQVGDRGGVITHGGQVLAQTVGATQLVADSAIITNELQVDSAVVNNAAIKDGAITELKVATAAINNAAVKDYIQSSNWDVGGNKEGWRMDKSAGIQGQDLTIYDSSGNIAISSGANINWDNITGTNIPAPNADVTDYADGRVANMRVENAAVHITRVASAGFVASNTGYLYVNLPTAKAGSNTMMKFTVDVFLYNTTRSFSLEVSGYNYGSGGWLNCTARLIGSTAGDNAVTFLSSATAPAIRIGNSSSSWPYCKVVVRDFQGGHLNYATGWDSGWDIDISSSAIGTAEVTISDALIDAQAIKNQGNFATLDQVNSGNITTYMASAAIQSAQIASLAVTNAKIATAAVDSLQVAGDAVTVMRFAKRTSDINLSYGAWTAVLAPASITLPAGNTGVLINLWYDATCVGTGISGDDHFWQVRRGSTIIGSWSLPSNLSIDKLYQIFDTPGTGTFAYTLHVRMFGSTMTVKADTSLAIDGAKR